MDQTSWMCMLICISPLAHSVGTFSCDANHSCYYCYYHFLYLHVSLLLLHVLLLLLCYHYNWPNSVFKEIDRNKVHQPTKHLLNIEDI